MKEKLINNNFKMILIKQIVNDLISKQLNIILMIR